MALVIHSNGIVEELLPVENVFNDKELVDSFQMYTELKTHRLIEIPNTWCLWGYLDNPPENEFNKLGSEIVDDDIYSHLIFIHDSELNHEWILTDKIIFKEYKEFLDQIGSFINEINTHISNEQQLEYEKSDKSSMIFLTAMGHTKDKRVLFGFNPNEQSENFYIDDGWDTFSYKIYEYLQENFDKEPIEENKPFVIFSDSKTIVIIENKHVDNVIKRMIDKFESKENYEKCAYISDVKDKWYDRKTILNIDSSTGKVKKRRGRPPKKKAD